MVVLISSTVFGFVVFGVFENEDSADAAILEFRKENKWCDSHHFEVYSGEQGKHMLEMWS